MIVSGHWWLGVQPGKPTSTYKNDRETNVGHYVCLSGLPATFSVTQRKFVKVVAVIMPDYSMTMQYAIHTHTPVVSSFHYRWSCHSLPALCWVFGVLLPLTDY